MKRFFKLLMLLAVISFVACENELDDVYNELNLDNIVVGVETYTFTSEDYAEYEDELGGEEFFETQDQADEIIPDFLADKYPVWGEGSLVNVTYNLFDETVLETMTASGILSNLGGIDSYLSSNYETAPDGTFVELTYDATILSNTLSDGDIEDIAIRMVTEYPEAAQSADRFGNFDRRSSNPAYWSDTMILEGLYRYLGEEYSVGQVVVITFPIYDGGTNFSETFVVMNNGYKFLKLDVDATGSDAIEYTLTDSDYDTIAADLATAYPGPAANVGRFGSFDVRSSSSNYWSDAMLLEALNIVLPAASEGDVYAVTYLIYNGSVTTETKTLLYTSGAYVENETTVEVSPVVAKNDGDWVFPYTFTRADFDMFGFRFPNFSSSNIYILDIHLKDLFPYAQAGDVAMVQYDYFSGGVSTKYGHSVFDGDNWHLTPDVIQTSFQYGFEDGEWVPDNTIVYALLSADIALIESTFIDIYPGPADNVGFFGSFDRRPGSGNFWSDAMLLEAFNVVLDARDPGAEEGQKYSLTFLTYIGSTVPETKLVIKVDGEWVYQE
ncbi:hypothetical protein [Aestuariivivens sediminicola]|uniref:hypothetical protein n=1 Tax=Aestuariivivens sediminicola TaxID=2913560 RepID=UPI001F56FF14|nr:hypothetical protein [Aestuariivivens sediminicola]